MTSGVFKLADLDDPNFDPFAAEESAWGTVVDPYPVIAEYRHRASVHELEFRTLFTDVPDQTMEGRPIYSVFGYDEVMEVFSNPRTYSSAVLRENVGLAFGETIVVRDPPEHTRYRRILQKAFLPDIIQTWDEEIITPVILRLMDKFLSRGKADMVSEFTARYPFEIIYHQLGLPEEEAEIFHRLAISQVFWASDPGIVREAGRKLGDYFGILAARLRENPGTDLISMLATAQADDEYLPDELVISFLRQLINAAGDTTYRTTGTLLMCLLNHPDQLKAVREDRSLIPAAIQETLRWDGPVLMNWRNTARDVVLGGVEIPEGSVVNVIAGSANRDERKFADPDKFDIYRTSDYGHFGFGMGPHICIGRHFARLEMERALNAVLDNLANIRLDPDFPPPVSRGFSLRTPDHIHVLFD